MSPTVNFVLVAVRRRDYYNAAPRSKKPPLSKGDTIYVKFDGAPILSHHPMKYVQITSNKHETTKYTVFPVYYRQLKSKKYFFCIYRLENINFAVMSTTT